MAIKIHREVRMPDRSNRTNGIVLKFKDEPQWYDIETRRPFVWKSTSEVEYIECRELPMIKQGNRIGHVELIMGKKKQRIEHQYFLTRDEVLAIRGSIPNAKVGILHR